MKSIFVLKSLLLLSIINPFTVTGQDWQWKWATNSYGLSRYNSSKVLGTDPDNSIFTGTSYSDSLFTSDSVFYHPGYEEYTRHQLITRFDHKGNITGYIDLHTSLFEAIYSTSVVTSSEGSVFVAGEFHDILYIGDTAVLPLPHQGFQFPNIFLAKFSPGLRLQWVKLIGGDTQNALLGLESSGDEIIMMCNHMPNGYEPFYTYLLGQDTIYSIAKPVYSLIRIDADGNIKRRTSFETGSVSFSHFMEGGDHLYYAFGYTYGVSDIVIGGDTVHAPLNPENFYLPFLICYDTDFNFVNGWIKDWDVFFHRIEVNTDGSLIFTTRIYDSITIDGTVVRMSGDSIVSAIGKIDTDESLGWITTLRSPHIQGDQDLFIALVNGNVFFTLSYMHKIIIGDTLLQTSYWYDNLIGRLDNNGRLAQSIISNTDYSSRMSGVGTDNCGNFLITGWFIGQGIYGADTIVSKQYWSTNDLFVAYLDLDNYHLDLGPDTLLKRSHAFTLSMPAGFDGYLWSNGDTTRTVSFPGNYFSSGQHILWGEVYNGYCITRDSINIEVINDIGFEEHESTGLSLYPNPAADEIIIKLNDAGCNTLHTVIIIDITGHQIINKEFKGAKTQLDISALLPGFYLIRVSNEKTVCIEKFVKK